MTDARTRTEIAAMLKENTGRHICDSGGYGGRHWERNQGKDFDAEPECTTVFRTYDGRSGEVDVSVSLYHWLCARLRYDERLDDLFSRFCDRPSQKNQTWWANMENFLEFLGRFGWEIKGFYDDGDPRITYTYNEENCLSQDVQFILFNACGPNEDSSTSFVLLHSHNGADARGGFPRPRAFEVVGESDETCMFDYNRLVLSCDGKSHDRALCPNKGSHLKGFGYCVNVHPGDYHRWESDNAGYGWCDVGDGNVPRDLRYLKGVEIKDLPDAGWSPGTIWVVDGKGLCPVCGGELAAYPGP